MTRSNTRELDLQRILDRLAHAIWAPRDQRYLLSIAQRLLEASITHPKILDLLELTAEDLSALPQLVFDAARTSLDAHARLEYVAQDPLNWAERRDGIHPLAGIMDLMPGYTIALTTFPRSSELHDAFEQLITQVLITLIEQNLSKTFEDYNKSATQLLLRELNAREALGTNDLPPNTHNHHQLSLSARKCVSRLSLKSSADWDDRDHQTWQRFVRQVKRYLTNPDRPPRNVQKSSRKQQRRASTVNYRSKSSATHIRSPLELLELEYIDPIDPSPELIIKKVRISEKHARMALSLDLSPYEFVEEDSFDVGTETHEFHTPASVKIAGRFQKKQQSNAAQLLTWATANLTPAKTETLIHQLRDAAQQLSPRGLAASFLLASLALGRPLEDLLPLGLALDREASSIADIADDEHALAVVLPKLQAIAIKVNQADVKNKYDWAGTVTVTHSVLVPDYFNLGQLLTRFGEAVRAPGSRPSRQIKNAIQPALTQLTKHLANQGITTAKIWQALPRYMQSESGMSTGMALLTGWQTQNSKVELHYHTVPANLLASRYTSAMSGLLGDSADDHVSDYVGDHDHHQLAPHRPLFPEQMTCVGAFNCPSDESTQKLVRGFQKAMASHRDVFVRAHNLLTLYTLFVCTAGFGLRHSIDPDFAVNRYGALSWLCYVEKGQHRQLLLPAIVDQQLRLYEAHIHRARLRMLFKPVIDKHRFFLLDEVENNKFRQISPGSIGKELEAYDIDFPLPLNSYRRWMFSKLFEAGQRGIGTDFFGGHGVAGRLPLTETNSTTIDVYVELAENINRQLINAGWTVLS